MSKWHLFVPILLILPVGCGGPSAPPLGLHGGKLIPLPDEMGSVEILKESVSGKTNELRVVIYFLDLSRKLISPEPTDVSLKLRGGRDAKVVEFKPAGASDPDKTGALISPPLANALELIGELSAKIGHKPVTLMIRSR